MNGYELLKGMSYVDPRFVEESADDVRPHKRHTWKWILPVAACLCLTFGRIWAMWQPAGEGMDTAISDVQSPSVTPESQECFKLPALRIRVTAVTEGGFTGTILESDSAAYPPGMEMNFQIDADTSSEVIYRGENDSAFSAIGDEALPDELNVAVLSYDSETNTAIIQISPKE